MHLYLDLNLACGRAAGIYWQWKGGGYMRSYFPASLSQNLPLNKLGSGEGRYLQKWHEASLGISSRVLTLGS